MIECFHQNKSTAARRHEIDAASRLGYVENSSAGTRSLMREESSISTEFDNSLEDKKTPVASELRSPRLSSAVKLVVAALSLLQLVSAGGFLWIDGLWHAQISELQGRIGTLQNAKDSLEQENAKLRETADSYYKHGAELKSAGDYAGARDTFSAILTKFPTSELVSYARTEVGSLDDLIAQAQADAAEADRRKQEEQERQAREKGEPIDYDILYGKVNGAGLPLGKRFRFSADLQLGSGRFCGLNPPGRPASMYMGCHPGFEDEVQYEHALRTEGGKGVTVVASMAPDGYLTILKIEY